MTRFRGQVRKLVALMRKCIIQYLPIIYRFYLFVSLIIFEGFIRPFQQNEQ